MSKSYIVDGELYKTRYEAVQAASHLTNKRIEIWENRPGKRLDKRMRNGYGSITDWLNDNGDHIATFTYHAGYYRSGWKRF